MDVRAFRIILYVNLEYLFTGASASGCNLIT
jgi:hypothetical protein